jgi:hypothetical protein
VTTTPADLDLPQGSVAVLQNLGTGAVYVDTESTVSSSTSYKLASGASFEFPRTDGSIWVVSDGTADLRILFV